MTEIKFVYSFDEGNEKMHDLLGKKGANLAEMVALGLPVPHGFIITTEVCSYYNLSKTLSNEIKSQIDSAVVQLENASGRKLGDCLMPLIFSVRSGSRVSMPGMMSTILNLGLNDQVVENIAKNADEVRFAYDSYRRLIMMFSNVVAGIDSDVFTQSIDSYKKKLGVSNDSELDGNQMKEISVAYKNIYCKSVKKSFPQNVREQLYEAICAVFRSWDNERATFYRKIHNIPYEYGTAAIVQSMVFGNIGSTSGTGVVFSRNPITGENTIYGEYLMNAQGEDVVAGTNIPKPISELNLENPDVFEDIRKWTKLLETHYKDVQEVEFTIENNRLFLLQTRTGNKTPEATLKISVDFVKEGLISKKEALKRVDIEKLKRISRPVFNANFLNTIKPIGKGLPASPGSVNGKIYFSSEDAREAASRGEKVILVRKEISTGDIGGMYVSEGVLTVAGGLTSHAAVVAHDIGVCCIVGCSGIEISVHEKKFTLDGKIFNEGDTISMDGSTGYIYSGKIPTDESELSDDLALLTSWING